MLRYRENTDAIRLAVIVMVVKSLAALLSYRENTDALAFNGQYLAAPCIGSVVVRQEQRSTGKFERQ